MLKLSKLFLLTILLAITTNTFAQKVATSKFKCMVQMSNYIGEGAYIVISLIDPKGGYEKTLYMIGPDKKWYADFKEWNKFYTKKPHNLSAITGASVAGGDRSINVIEIETAKINKGYKLRFESAVEDKEYYVKDLEMDLTTANLATKTDGKGFIRYVRFSPN